MHRLMVPQARQGAHPNEESRRGDAKILGVPS